MKTISPISIPIVISILLLTLPGCTGSGARLDPPAAAEHTRVDALQRAILSLGDDVDPEEARRAARVSIAYSRQLAHKYDLAGSPLFHNMMVNLGFRDRGLCVDWTHDLLVRLRQERFLSLDLHWGIANYESTFRLEHNTVIVSARGDRLQQGLVLDAWRHSGELYWAPANDDPGYAWRPFDEIQALKDRRAELKLERRVSR